MSHNTRLARFLSMPTEWAVRETETEMAYLAELELGKACLWDNWQCFHAMPM